jgi:hypothetical protein
MAENSLTCFQCGRNSNQTTRLYISVYEEEGKHLYLCEDCGTICEYCQMSALYRDLSPLHSSNVCKNCFENLYERSQNKINSFYEKFPNLKSFGIIEKAAQKQLMPTSYYEILFNQYPFFPGYGGSNWADIAKTCRKLEEYSQLLKNKNLENFNELEILLDHAFDLVHNNGSIFTKNKSVMKWILSALNTKRDKDPIEYLNVCSSDVQKLYKKYHQVSIQEKDSWLSQIDRKNYDFYDKIIKYIKSENISELVNNIHRMPNEFNTNHKLGFLAKFIKAFILSGKSIVVSTHQLRALINFIEQPKETKTTKYLPMFAIDFNFLKQFIGDKIYTIVEKIPDSYLNLSVNALYSVHEECVKWISEAKKYKSLNKTAALNNQNFYNFYLLTTINCNEFKDEDTRVCKFLKNIYIKEILNDLINILKEAIVHEASHVSDIIPGEVRIRSLPDNR